MRDAECVAKLGADPGVCMSHQDGRCATSAETIFVEDKAGCATAAGSGAGTAATPFCSMQPAVIALASDRRLVVVRGTVQAANYVIQGGAGASQISIVGQRTGSVGGGAYSGLVADMADVFARDISFRASLSPGVFARNGSSLYLEHVAVDQNPGGGVLIDSASFDIRNSRITANGPADIMGFTWGGMRVQGVPPTRNQRLELVTIQNNNAPGLSCSTAIDGSGVLASDNAATNISPTCGITPCSPAGPTCGAQP
jgi:hypothetical protein